MNETAKYLESVTKNGRIRFKLKGEIDHHSAKTIRKRIDAELFISRPDEIILDLSEVEFMDSSGLGLILGRYQAATEMGVAFSIYEPTEAVRRILKLSGCEKMINITGKRSDK